MLHRLAHAAFLLSVLIGASIAAPETDDSTEAETPWPYEIANGTQTLRIYQPQLESWDGALLKVRAAVSVLEENKDAPIYGVIDVQARTLVDKQQRIVTLDRVQVVSSEFPSAPEKASSWAKLVEQDTSLRKRTIALDRLEAALEIDANQSMPSATAVRNDPPQIIFTKNPALLIYIDGTAVYRVLDQTHYDRIINTRALIVRSKSGVHFLKIFDGWMSAPGVLGPWVRAQSLPTDLQGVLDAAVRSRQVDLLTGQSDPQAPAPSLAKATPEIHIATRPTELIVTNGEPNWVSIQGTQLLYVDNTTGNLFKLLSDQKTYVLLSGRWFRSSSLQGPWEFVPADKLAQDFAAIPDDSPKENVKASVSGTPQAKEAAIAANIPESAAVHMSAAKMFQPTFDGEPQFKPIAGTPLHYVANTATPVIQIDAKTYFALENAVWFSATSLFGPWTVASSVPAIIYSIPPSSHLYYVTHVKIYGAEQDTLYVGYTPGYEGEYVDPVTHVVVYGTGYYYTPWVGTVWYGPPVTYGFGVALRYTPWTGWTIGYGFGWTWGAATVVVGWGWGAYPWWGPYGWGWSWGPPMYPIYPVPYWGGAAIGPRGAVAWGPGGWVASTGNVYRRWGNTATVSRASRGYNAWTGNAWAREAGMAYNSRTGTLAAGQRGAAANVYTGRYATSARGGATNAQTGMSAATRQGTVGSAVTGREVSAGQSAIYNRNTGEIARTGHISGENGTIARVNDDIYAGHDGNVYRRNGNGWDQIDMPDRPTTLPSDTRQQLERDYEARSQGTYRYDGRQQSTRSMPRASGGRRRR